MTCKSLSEVALLLTLSATVFISSCAVTSNNPDPIEVYQGPLATIDFTNHPQLFHSTKFLNRQISMGPNFAGHYHIAYMSCGTQCRDNVIVDSISGSIVETFQSCSTPIFSINSVNLNTEIRTPNQLCVQGAFSLSNGELVKF